MFSRGEGESIWFLLTLLTIKSAGLHTGGAFTLVEQILPSGFAPPPHIHHIDDVAFYIFEGELTVFCGDNTWQVSPGSLVFLPKDVVHRFRVEGTTPAKMLQITSPAGFEHFAAEAGEPAKEMVPPLAPPPDVPKLLAATAKYGYESIPPQRA